MKRLVICFDGTWNTADSRGHGTNVVRLARMILPRDAEGVPQMVFYDPGVGTGNVVDKYIGGIAGEGLESHVKAGYLFLAQNYEPGDEVYIFGFSRGAFTARSLCGFIGACRGLLKRDMQHKIAQAWSYYRTKPAERDTVSFRSDILSSVSGMRVKLLGVWDTVGALGIPTDWFNTYNQHRYAFHDTALSSIVENAFQALAIDEHRGPFEATLWEKPSSEIADQIVEQVWFPGAHADVGGGYANSESSDLALRWMIARISLHSNLAIERESRAYFTPELVKDDELPQNTSRAAAIARVMEKAKGVLHDSLGFYVFSRFNPRMRIIGGAKPQLGVGPLKKVFRFPSNVTKKPFCESIHWSAIARRKAGSFGGAKYDPPNLRVALDDIPVLLMEDEVKRGSPWLGRA